MTDLGFLTEFMVPVIVGICLCVGYVVKKWIKDVDNKYIPTICAALGIILAIWINGWTITAPILLSGLDVYKRQGDNRTWYTDKYNHGWY